MCWHCVTILKDHGEVVPGYYLYQYDDKYCLSRGNYPDFEFSVEPVKDPYFYMSDEEIDNDTHLAAAADLYWDAVGDFEKCLITHPIEGYKLVKSCVAAGFDIKEYGNVAPWLLHKIAERLESTYDVGAI